MTEAKMSTPKRVLRILLGGVALASAWLAVDLLVHADTASASETVDVVPVDISGGSDPVADIISSVATPIAPIAAPVVSPVAQTVAPVLALVAGPVEQVTTPIASPVIAAVTPVIEAATTPLAPIVSGVVEGVVGALPVVAQLNITPSLGALISGGGLVLGAVIGASIAPLLPLPVNGGNRNGPVTPEAFGGTASAAAANLHSLVVPGPGSALHRNATTGAMPASPTYGFDTTPD